MENNKEKRSNNITSKRPKNSRIRGCVRRASFITDNQAGSIPHNE